MIKKDIPKINIETEKKPEKPEQFPAPEEFINILEKHSSPEHVAAYEKVLEISQAIKEAGGQALLVGGSVRDVFFGKASKDFDIEVYKLDPQELEKIVKQFGKVSDVGKAFGILKISFGQGIDIDISLPRTDSKIGVGHRGFEVKADPNMSIEDAARRRDFTMNSIAADPLTGELSDPFGGVKDIRERRLRITDAERFQDDPLRVMRALQFIGRFGLELDHDSAELIRKMMPQLKELPKERIYEEWKKLLLKSEKPSLGIAAGMSLGVFQEIHPEFPPLKETPQEPKWHPEGDVWIHTLMTVDEAAKISRRENLNEDESLILLLSSLCHDLGKASTTEFMEGRIKSHGHEQAGEEPTKKFLAQLGTDNLTRKKVPCLVINHLTPTMLFINETIKGEKVSDGTIRRLAQRLHPATIKDLVSVAEADHSGRGPFSDPEIPEQLLLPDGFPAGPWLLKKARKLEVEKSQPVDLIRGRDLINLGYKPGSQIGQLIRLANQLRDEKGFTKEAVLQKLYNIEEQEAVKRLKNLF